MEINLGLVSICQDSFTGNKEKQLKDAINGLKDREQELGFKLITYEKLIKGDKEALKAKNFFNEKGVDLLFVQNSSFASGTLVAELARGNYKIGLWGRKETANTGKLPLNSFCGTNMNAGVLASKQGNDYKFKWFYGDVEDDLFLPRLKVTLGALRGIKKLTDMRIGLLIGPAPGFANLEFSYEKLRENLGVEVELIKDFNSLLQEAEAVESADVKREIKRIKDNAAEVKVDDIFVEKSARYSLALHQLAFRENYDGLALRCWPDTNREYGIFPCSAIGKLNETGLPTSCEGDVYGVINMALIRAITGENSLLLDLSDLDFDNQRALLWHCGSGARDFARDGEYNEDYHFNNTEYGMVTDMVIKPMEATVLNMTDNGSQLFFFNGRFLDTEDQAFHGDRGWFGDFQHPLSGSFNLKDLVNTIYGQRLSHHYAIAAGDITAEILEMKRWLGLKEVPIIEYDEYLV